MAQYEKIQFIGYEVCTAPKNAVFNNEGYLLSGEYVGIADNDAKDIAMRCRLMMDAVLTADKNRTMAADDDKTLKLFVAPEFFFRGAKGAYAMEEVQLVISSLQDMIKDAHWKDWMFVFGSIIGFSSPTFDEKSLISQIYEIDPDKVKEAYNVVLVQQGGFGDDAEARENGARVVMKEFMSNMDFIQLPDEGLSFSTVEHIKPLPGTRNEEQIFNYDGLGKFQLSGITFGLEICLDHLQGRLKASPLINDHDSPLIQVQIVPSCGASIEGDSLVVQPGGYVINVDGNAPASELQAVSAMIPQVRGNEFPVDITLLSPPVEPALILADRPGLVKIYETVKIPEQMKAEGYVDPFSYTCMLGVVLIFVNAFF